MQVDRLITELKLPPADAYHKLRHTIEDVNAAISAACGGTGAADREVDPVKVWTKACGYCCMALHPSSCTLSPVIITLSNAMHPHLTIVPPLLRAT